MLKRKQNFLERNLNQEFNEETKFSPKKRSSISKKRFMEAAGALGTMAAGGIISGAEAAPALEQQQEQQTTEQMQTETRSGILNTIRNIWDRLSTHKIEVKGLEEMKNEVATLTTELQEIGKRQEVLNNQYTAEIKTELNQISNTVEKQSLKAKQEMANDVIKQLLEIQQKVEQFSQKMENYAADITEAEITKDKLETEKIKQEMSGYEQEFKQNMIESQAKIENLRAQTELTQFTKTTQEKEQLNRAIKEAEKSKLNLGIGILMPSQNIRGEIAGELKVRGIFGKKAEATEEGNIKITDPGTRFELAFTDGLKGKPAAELTFGKDIFEVKNMAAIDSVINSLELGGGADWQTNFRECLSKQFESGERGPWAFQIEQIKPFLEGKVGSKIYAMNGKLLIEVEGGLRFWASQNSETGKWGFSPVSVESIGELSINLKSLGITGKVEMIGNKLTAVGVEKEFSKKVLAGIERRGDVNRFKLGFEF